MSKTRAEMTEWILRVAKKSEIHYELEQEEDRDIIRMNYSLESAVGYARVVIAVDEDGDIRSFGFIDNSGEKNLAAVGEYLMRANWAIFHGEFLLDYEDGEIRFFSVTGFSEFDDDEDIEILWKEPLHYIEKFGDGLLKVILGCSSPKEAYEEAVKDDDKDEEEE